MLLIDFDVAMECVLPWDTDFATGRDCWPCMLVMYVVYWLDMLLTDMDAGMGYEWGF